jgi:hypothetical protein
MAEVSKIKNAGLPLQAGMLACFSFMAVYWIRVAQFGGFSLEAHSAALLCLVAASCASVYSPATIFRVLSYCAPWFLAYVAYLLLYIPAAAGTPGFGLLTKQALFLAGFLCIAAFFSRLPEPAKLLRRAALCGIVLYLIFTEYSGRLIGKSLIGATIDFLGSGSFKGLIYGFFRPVFNSLESGPQPTFVASLTNSIAASLVVLAICFRIGGNRRRVDVLGSVITVAIVLLCLLLNARSAVLAALASLAMAFVVRLAVARAVSLMEMLYWCVIAVVLVGAAAVLISRGASAVDSIITAFEFSDNSAGVRLDQYGWALGLIENRLFLGHGYLETADGLPIHNLFLSSWAYVGLVGFALILIFYVGLVAAWLRWLYLAVTRQDYWVLDVRLEWVAVLPILPLFRVWPAYAEWVALGVFFGLVLRNEMERQAAAGGWRADSIRFQPYRHFESKQPARLV